jgi:hypothetical protein
MGEQVAVTPQCEECREVWLPGGGERWSAYWIDERAEERLLFYCPACADREFKS